MHRVETEFGSRTLSLETGRLAEQANGAVVARYGETVVLATAVMSDSIRAGIDFFPLSVDFEERTYAIGRIPGGVLRREGRPPLSGVLAARLTDRPLRPLFPKGMRNEVQIIVTLLSHDGENEIDVLGMVAASAALTISDIPFEGPIGAVRVGLHNGEFSLNPTISDQAEHGDLDLVVAGTSGGVVMLEAGAQQVDDDLVARAVHWGQEKLQALIDLQERLRTETETGVTKRDPVIESLDTKVRETVESHVATDLHQAIRLPDQTARDERMSAIRTQTSEAFADRFESADIEEAVHEVESSLVRDAILNEGLRPDGRSESDIRTMSAGVGMLPRTHGTGLFQRGQTQVMSVVTLGTPRDAQRIGLSDLESMVEPKRFLHHYNMPPFASGETGRTGSPRRREIGHGALVERALESVIPSFEDFPYTIRIVSEVLSSNGSTSMASVCGGTLALMDAGVPIAAPVAGISIGLVDGGDGEFRLLTDIQGAEDHFGDMDFKVAGTREGVTGVQVDIKVKHLTPEQVDGAFARAREARMKILDVIGTAITSPRDEVAELAPKLVRTSIPPDSIGSLIGPGGKTIRRLEAESEAKIDVEEDGTIIVAAPTREGVERVVQMVQDLTGQIEIGRTLLGKVTRIFGFGAMVEIVPGREGLVPKHELAEEPVRMIEDIVNIDDDIMVKVIEIDDRGRPNLSRRAVLLDLTPEEALATARPAPRPPRRDDRPQHDGRGDRGRNDGPPRRRPRRYD